MRVALTGATGLVGAACVDAFTDAADEVVRLVRRSVAPRAGCRDIPVGDLGRPEFLVPPELPPCEIFIHAAARVPNGRMGAAERDQVFHRTNVIGTLNALELAGAANARRFIFVSSIKVNGEETVAGRQFRADDIPQPEDAYARSKLKAENLVREACVAKEMEAVVIRPPLVYGPHAKGNFKRMLSLVSLPFPLPLGGVRNSRSMVSDRNLADLILNVAHYPRPLCATFLARDPEVMSTPRMFLTCAELQGETARLFAVPPLLLKLARKIPVVGPHFKRLTGNLEIDLDSNPAAMNWLPPYSTESELARTVRDREA